MRYFTEFFQVFHPLFCVSYSTLLICSIYIFKIYFLENENPNPLLSLLCIGAFFGTIMHFPKSLGESLLAFAGYVALAAAPSSFLVIIIAKVAAETLVGAKDFMKTGRRDAIEEIQEQIESLVIAAKFEEAVGYIRDKMKKYPKDYRFNQEIANIALMHQKDYGTALTEFAQVLRKTDKEEPVAFSLYRMVDIYLNQYGDKIKARECLKKIIQLFPSSDYSKSAKIRLEFLEEQEQEEAPVEAPPIAGAPGGTWRSGAVQLEMDESLSELARYLGGDSEESTTARPVKSRDREASPPADPERGWSRPKAGEREREE